MTDGAPNDLQGLVGQYNWDSIKMHADVDLQIRLVSFWSSLPY